MAHLEEYFARLFEQEHAAAYRVYRQLHWACYLVYPRVKFLFDNFEHFIAEVGDPPTPQHRLYRRQKPGHVAPGNVAWATPAECALIRRAEKESNGPSA